jgi:hypothetical protein
VTALAVINIKRSLDKNHAISERDAHILLAFLDAQANRTEELKALLIRVIPHLDGAVETHDGMVLLDEVRKAVTK